MRVLNIILLFVVTISAESLPIESNKTKVDINDTINSCLGISKKNLDYCTLIIDKDKKSTCFGIVKRDSGYCAMVKDEDMKNRCLSIALSDITHCDKIKDKDSKQVCKSLYREIESEENQEDCK
ncbi:hypothetical protein GSY74_08320 [Sulfurovum sp. bin170]|uniref:hypothetical protein n=1 Tax=Sulfurovum sp. bin170 TaxID=2695268 RepID=UPI0013DF347C|nr:hypothetical protein [Sulfurovum sp. bin170]NEW61286.1 hypothetical protein [Sulfurovum sp. bin170]